MLRNGIMWFVGEIWRNSEKYLTKGKQIYVEGKIKTRSWEDNGVKKYITEIVADNFTMLGTRSGSGTNEPSEPNNKMEKMIYLLLAEEMIYLLINYNNL